ncbi:hypothetical protein BDD12DRAFT_794098, partial [Trichophaea hybrida]
MSSTSSSHITGSHNTTNTRDTTTTSSNNATDNSRTYHQDSKHIEQHIYNVDRDDSQARHDRQLRHDRILESIAPQTEKSVFLGLLPPMTSQDKYISPVNPDDPKLCWIFQDINFKDWESTVGSQVLWIFGPPDRGITEVASHFVGLTKRNASGAVFYFFCSMLERETSVVTTFAHSVLHHILNSSSDNQARSIVTTFLSTLLHKILERNQWHFREEDSSVITVKKILDTSSGGELLRALTETVVKIETILDTTLIIDGIDKLGKEGAQFLEKFCSQAIVSPKFKALLTCRPDPHIKEIVNGVLCIEYDKERQECLNSLLHHDTRYDKISKEHEGSLEWLWTHEKYQKWSSSERSSLLYIEGKPGSGKSTLAKYFRENLVGKEQNASSSIIVKYFYTLRGTTLELTHENMLRSVLYSILKKDETFFFLFQSEFRKFKSSNDSKWPYTSLQQILSSLASHPFTKRLYLILDAMDESEENDRREIIELLCRLCAESKSCIIKIFLASRPVSQFKHEVKKDHHVIRLQDENKKDISKFARSFLGPDLDLPPEILNQATEYIVEKAQGVFIWVYLVKEKLLEYAERGCTKKQIFECLKSLPTELEAFYRDILRELEKREEPDIKDGLRMFRFVLFTYRPLRLAELRHALAIPDNPDVEFLTSDESFEEDLIHGIDKRVVHCGGNFLEIKGPDEDRSVQLMHQTVREFFLRPTAKSRFRMSYEDSHIRISITCLRYLMLCAANTSLELPSVDTWTPKHYEAYAEYLKKRPFINYALSHLTQHIE